MFSSGDIRPELVDVAPAVVVGDLKLERRTAIPVPHLHGVDPVPMRHLTGLQQKQDCGGVRTATVTRLVPEGLAEPAALGVRLKLMMGDDFFGGQRLNHP
jgi:hypothetical protein